MALPHDLQLHRRVPPRHPGDQGDLRGEAGHPGPPVLIPPHHDGGPSPRSRRRVAVVVRGTPPAEARRRAVTGPA
ncbi:hypothetical protein MICRO116_90012 [Micrococcus sp. 116]|nr:hypothetical protein MICRO116_90012 [Micrococcus sp. 116]